jgi:glycosyltransferase involved in cell wall biosynthesis
VKALRVYHSGVVGSWRARDRAMRAAGAEVTLVSPLAWNEGGATVALDAGDDHFVVAARTVGRHPYAFVYDPRPLWRLLRCEHWDVLDVHEEPASLAAGELLLLRTLARSGAPVLVYGAQNLEKRFPPPFRWIERAVLRSAAAAFVCNREAGEIYRRKGFAGTVRTIGLGVDVERFAPRKGVHVVLEALAGLPTDIELHVHGAGPDGVTLQHLAAFFGLGDRAVFHGFAAHADLPEVYRSFHALVVPSQTTASWVEQFGRVVIEAMASGVPVVASDSGALPEVVGDAGIVVGESNVGDWRRALAGLAEDASARRALVTAGLDRARAFDWRAIAGEHLALWREVAG